MSACQVYVEIPERPIYVGGTGPTMKPPTLLSSNEGDRGWKIVGMVELNNVSQYVISPKLNLAHRRAVKQQHIRSWVSQRDVEAFDFSQTYSDSDLDWDAENQDSEQSKTKARKGLAESVRYKSRISVALPRYQHNLVYRRPEETRNGISASRAEAMASPKPTLNGSLKRKLSTSAIDSGLKRKHSALLGDIFSSRRTQTAQPSLSSPPQQSVTIDEEDGDLEIFETLPVQQPSNPFKISQRGKDTARIAPIDNLNIKRPESPLWEVPAQTKPQDTRFSRSRSASVSFLTPGTRAGSQILLKSPPAFQAQSQGTRVQNESDEPRKGTRAAARQGSITSTVSSTASKKNRKKAGHSRFTKVKGAKAARKKGAEWEVKAILGEEVRREKGKDVIYYQIDWEGDWEPTWEPANNVSADTIEGYQKQISSTFAKKGRPKLDEEDNQPADSVEKSQTIASTDNSADNSTSEDGDLRHCDILVDEDAANHTGKTGGLPLIPKTSTVLLTGRNQEISNQPRTPVSNSTNHELSMISDFARFTNFLDEEEP